MNISEKTVVGIDYKLTDDQGQLIDQSDEQKPFYYLHGAGQIIPGLESELEGKSTGDEVKVTLEPESGYGVHNPELLRAIPREMFEEPEKLQSGQQFELQDDSGVQLYTITEVKDDEVIADGNHVLAGKTLTFDVAVREVRDATNEELQHGHAHPPGAESH